MKQQKLRDATEVQKQAIANVQKYDKDKDKFLNEAEVKAGRLQKGWTRYMRENETVCVCPFAVWNYTFLGYTPNLFGGMNVNVH